MDVWVDQVVSMKLTTGDTTTDALVGNVCCVCERERESDGRKDTIGLASTNPIMNCNTSKDNCTRKKVTLCGIKFLI